MFLHVHDFSFARNSLIFNNKIFIETVKLIQLIKLHITVKIIVVPE